MASGILKRATDVLPHNDINLLTIWSDKCGGQNRNSMIIGCYLWIQKQFPEIKTINHKILLRGHTHMEIYMVHERARKKQSHLLIITPWNWQQLVRSCSKARDIEVINMELEDFKKFFDLFQVASLFVLRKKGTSGQHALVSSMVWMQLRGEDYGKLFYKESFEEENFQEVDLIRYRRIELNVNFPASLQQVRLTLKPISTVKYNDILAGYVGKIFL